MYFIYLIAYKQKTSINKAITYYYTGITTDFNRRWDEHLYGKKGAKALRSKILLGGAIVETAPDRSTAQKIEAKIKKITNKEKQVLFEGSVRVDKQGI